MFDPNRFDRQFRQDWRRSSTSFNTMFKLTLSAIVIIFLLIVAYWGIVGFLAFTAIDSISSDPKEAARFFGEIVKSFKEGAGK